MDRRWCIYALSGLRVTLAFVFLWFGGLKLLGVSPVRGLIEASFPAIAASPILSTALAVSELLIGLGLLLPLTARVAALVMVGHLTVATLGVLISPQAFAPSFPLLTIGGEFVVKNAVLIAAGLVIFTQQEERTS